MKIDVLLGLQWGDEGKGKIVDVFTPNYDIIARFQGGPNAGHTLEFDGKKIVLNTIPSGVFRENTINLIGNGVVINPITLRKELENLVAQGVDIQQNIVISKKAHLILPTHPLIDKAQEIAKGKNKIGSTLRGIGPTYKDKISRVGLRIGDILNPNFQALYESKKQAHILHLEKFDFGFELEKIEQDWFEAIDFIQQLKFVDSEELIQQSIENNKKILAEGAQGTLLDVDFGSYPFVTSSNTVAAGACTGLGIAPNKIGEVFGIFKAYCTRVGAGPFPTELFDETGAKMSKIGNEFGATTGRPRRCGWLDLVALKYAIQLNGVTQLIITKSDVLSGFEKIKVCTAYKKDGEKTNFMPYDLEGFEPIYTDLEGWEADLTQMKSFSELPIQLKNYVDYLETELKTPIKIVSVGPDRKQTLFK